jgi:hypothetical protein
MAGANRVKWTKNTRHMIELRRRLRRNAKKPGHPAAAEFEISD